MGKANKANQTGKWHFEDFLSEEASSAASTSVSECSCFVSNSQCNRSQSETQSSSFTSVSNKVLEQPMENKVWKSGCKTHDISVSKKCPLCSPRNTPCLCCKINGVSLLSTEVNKFQNLTTNLPTQSKKRQRPHRTNSNVSNKRRKLSPNIIDDCYIDDDDDNSTGYLDDEDGVSFEHTDEDGSCSRMSSEVSECFSKARTTNQRKLSSCNLKKTRHRATNTSPCSFFQSVKTKPQRKVSLPGVNIPKSQVDPKRDYHLMSPIPKQPTSAPPCSPKTFVQPSINNIPSFVGKLSIETSITESPCVAAGTLSVAEEIINTIEERKTQTPRNHPGTVVISDADETVISTTEKNNSQLPRSTGVVEDVLSRFVADEIVISTYEYNSCDTIIGVSGAQTNKLTETAMTQIPCQRTIKNETAFRNTITKTEPFPNVNEFNGRNQTSVNPQTRLNATECLMQSNCLPPNDCPCRSHIQEPICFPQNVFNTAPCQKAICAVTEIADKSPNPTGTQHLNNPISIKETTCCPSLPPAPPPDVQLCCTHVPTARCTERERAASPSIPSPVVRQCCTRLGDTQTNPCTTRDVNNNSNAVPVFPDIHLCSNVPICQTNPCTTAARTNSPISDPVCPPGTNPCCTDLSASLNQCVMSIISKYNDSLSAATSPKQCSFGCQTSTPCKESCIQTSDLIQRLHSSTQYSKTQIPKLICQCTQTQVKQQDSSCQYFLPYISNCKNLKDNVKSTSPSQKPTAVYTCSSTPDVRQLASHSSRASQQTLHDVIAEKEEHMRTVTPLFHENILNRETLKFSFRPCVSYHDKPTQVSVPPPFLSDLVIDYVKIAILSSAIFLLFNLYGATAMKFGCCHFVPFVFFLPFLLAVFHLSPAEAVERKHCASVRPCPEVNLCSEISQTYSRNCSGLPPKTSGCFRVPPYPQRTSLNHPFPSERPVDRLPCPYHRNNSSLFYQRI